MYKKLLNSCNRYSSFKTGYSNPILAGLQNCSEDVKYLDEFAPGTLEEIISDIGRQPGKTAEEVKEMTREAVEQARKVVEGGSYSHSQTLDGLDEIRKHLTNDVDGLDFEPNKAMMDKIEEMLSNNQELTGAYKDFYEHELTESALMKQGYGYDDAHNMALDIHDVAPQALYSPEVVEEYYKWFNKSDYEFWGITIGK